jgi:hypothetical protein
MSQQLKLVIAQTNKLQREKKVAYLRLAEKIHEVGAEHDSPSKREMLTRNDQIFNPNLTPFDHRSDGRKTCSFGQVFRKRSSSDDSWQQNPSQCSTGTEMSPVCG